MQDRSAARSDGPPSLAGSLQAPAMLPPAATLPTDGENGSLAAAKTLISLSAGAILATGGATQPSVASGHQEWGPLKSSLKAKSLSPAVTVADAAEAEANGAPPENATALPGGEAIAVKTLENVCLLDPGVGSVVATLSSSGSVQGNGGSSRAPPGSSPLDRTASGPSRAHSPQPLSSGGVPRGTVRAGSPPPTTKVRP